MSEKKGEIMITKNTRLRCDICNKFISFKENKYTWVPFGNRFDIEPPDEEHAHIKCYNNLNDNSKNLIIETSYIKPGKDQS